MFLVVDKRSVIVSVIIILLILAIFTTIGVAYCYIPRREYTIVIDVGHGGNDNGVVGKESGVTESEINLLVSFNLKSKLEERGVSVILTREGKSVLNGKSSTKKDDFEKRKSIINDAQPDVMVSIHQNKFPDASRRGAQVFFNAQSAEGKSLATAVQSGLNELNLQNVNRTYDALKGDYYILNCSSYPSCIVECGFLSNPEDEKLLLDATYRDELCKKITKGIFAYLNESST